MAKNTIKVDIKTDAAIRRIYKIQNKIIKQGFVSANDMKDLGKNTAQTLVPKGKTRWLYNSIRGEVITERSGAKAKIYLYRTIVPVDGIHRYSKGSYPKFNLARWMHTSGKAAAQIKSGDPKFMYTTMKVLEGMGLEKVKKGYNQLISKL